ncbi:MFS transporter [Actinomadura sp. WAC 06369]|uniref:MFS transporter n=1 Tax=Actinomadura sp. WAC 06369 TaxID=2203193 RepID=UPI0018F7C926|nr:MFS transporter [Actinomadura sp. WAC 06369]
MRAAPAASGTGEEGGGTVGRRFVALLVTASFGLSMALVVPMAYSLALRVDRLAPGREETLGYILGFGSALALVSGPLVGTLSDRTRSRLGRRAPYLIGGAALGLAAVPVMAAAPNVAVLGLGWGLASLGWGTAMGALGSAKADRVPHRLRGRVSGLTGFTMQVAPVAGVLMVGAVSGSGLLVFLLPGMAGAVLLVPFLLFAREPDGRTRPVPGRLGAAGLLRSYLFSPRAHPDFAWNWLGRFAFFFGQSSCTTYLTFLIAQRLERPLADVAGIVAVTGGIGVAATTAAAIGGGFLSDRLGRRRPFVFAGAAVFAAGGIVLAFAGTLPVLLAGSALTTFGIALFTAVDQAIVLDVLPERETAAGRYMAINAFSQKAPGALAPLAAPALLAVGGGANYTVLYAASALLAFLGGSLVLWRVREAGRGNSRQPVAAPAPRRRPFPSAARRPRREDP